MKCSTCSLFFCNIYFIYGQSATKNYKYRNLLFVLEETLEIVKEHPILLEYFSDKSDYLSKDLIKC